jgi:hypothetical protein
MRTPRGASYAHAQYIERQCALQSLQRIFSAASHKLSPIRLGARNSNNRPRALLSDQEVRLGDSDPSGILQTEVVIDRVTQFLLAAEITLRRLNRCVPK